MSITSSDSHDKSLEMSSKNEEDDERNFPQDLTTTASSLIRNCIEGRQSSEETDSASYKSSKSRSHSSLTSSYHESPKESSEKVADCAGCGQGIRDRYYLFAVDQNWHVSCLKCHSCHVSLDSEVSCFTKEGKIFCKQDYFRWVLKSDAKNWNWESKFDTKIVPQTICRQKMQSLWSRNLHNGRRHEDTRG
jgi:hypothetical protein